MGCRKGFRTERGLAFIELILLKANRQCEWNQISRFPKLPRQGLESHSSILLLTFNSIMKFSLKMGRK